ncbi:hypothetical protein [Streptomyces sp. NBC_01353]|uniref:hypothetical protein n=1 Tax=Streptomyces sp. NBC_01353 TaxID=2903835 RepID=UPI002E32A5AE|nr:hypothetical protein [Streptomyces sp. NBC_01353]
MPTTEEPAGPSVPKTSEDTGASPTPGDTEIAPDGGRLDRGGISIGAALLLACGAFVTYGVLDTQDKPADERAAAPTSEVTYEVLGEGAADISYRGASGDRADVVTNVGLLWRRTVSVPLGPSPIVDVSLGEKGGTVSRTLAIGGRHVQRATATGAFGRTACSSELPTSEASTAPEGAQ